jgi:hypothetical protein
MPFPTALIFLLVLTATAAALLCICVGLFLFALPKSRGSAPYVALVYPATYGGGFVGVETAWRLNALVKASERWWLEIIVFVFLACFVGGAGLGGFLGYKLANRIAKHFQKNS